MILLDEWGNVNWFKLYAFLFILIATPYLIVMGIYYLFKPIKSFVDKTIRNKYLLHVLFILLALVLAFLSLFLIEFLAETFGKRDG